MLRLLARSSNCVCVLLFSILNEWSMKTWCTTSTALIPHSEWKYWNQCEKCTHKTFCCVKNRNRLCLKIMFIFHNAAFLWPGLLDCVLCDTRTRASTYTHSPYMMFQHTNRRAEESHVASCKRVKHNKVSAITKHVWYFYYNCFFFILFFSFNNSVMFCY